MRTMVNCKSRQLARLSVKSEFSVNYSTKRLKQHLDIHLFHQNKFLSEAILQRNQGSAQRFVPPKTIVITLKKCQ